MGKQEPGCKPANRAAPQLAQLSSAQLCSSLELNPLPCFTHVQGVLHTGGCSARRAPCAVAPCRGIVPRHAEPTISSSESPEESLQNIKPGEKEQKHLVLMERAQRKIKILPEQSWLETSLHCPESSPTTTPCWWHPLLR